MSLSNHGIRQLKENFKEVQKDYENFIRAFLVDMGLRGLGIATKNTPVDTGELRRAWQLSDVMRRGDELWIVLFNPMNYASFVEEGHMQYARWVPGYWKGSRFVYDPKAKTGMKLKTKWIEGHHMARIAISDVQRQIPIKYRRALKKFMSDRGIG